jgi:hypothetical protein
MPFQQVDPKYFDFASRFMQGQQQAVDRNAQQSEISRRNALLAMEQQAATQQNTLFNQGQQDRTTTMERESLQRLLNAASNLEGVANDPNAFEAVKRQVFSNPELAPILQKYDLSPEMVTPQSVAQFNAQLRAAGGAAAPQPQDPGPLQEYIDPATGQPIFGDRRAAQGKRAYHPPQAPPAPTSNQLITRPSGDGMAQDFAWDPKTNTRTPSGEPYKPDKADSGAIGTKAQQGKWQSDMRQAQIAMEQARKLAPEIGKAVGFISNLKTATARAAGQSGISGTEDVYGDVITARQKLSQFAQQSLTPLIMSQAKGTKEQERLLGLLPKSGAWFTNEAQAKRNINEIMDWVQMETDQNALNLNIDPQTLENRWEPLPINVTRGDSGDPEHDAKVDAIMNKSFGAAK